MTLSDSGVVSVWVVQQILLTLEKHGLDITQLRYDLKLTDENLRQTHRLVDKETFQALLRQGARALEVSIPEFGYLCGQQSELNAFGPAGFAAISAATYGEAIEIAARFLPLTAPIYSMSQEVHGDQVELIVRQSDIFSGEEREANYWRMEAVMRTFINAILKNHIASAILPNITIKMPAPADGLVAQRYAKDKPHLYKIMRFDQEYLALCGPVSLLDLSIKTANKFSIGELLESSEKLMAKSRTSVSQRVRDILHSADYGMPNLEETARLLNMSQRTIHRSLEREGTSFRALSRDTVIARAKTLLSESDKTITEISDLLGYSSASSFSSFFKRVCGESPRQFSARVRNN